jgi:hypothetical protein
MKTPNHLKISMKKTSIPLALVVSLLAAETASSETIAAWFPTGNDGPRGSAYSASANAPGADMTSAGILWTSARRSTQLGWNNAGAVWPGRTDLPEFSLQEYTSYALGVARASEIQIDSFFCAITTYSTERETVNGEVVLSTLQMRLRSSLDGFAADIGAVASLPDERVDANNIPFLVDLTEVEALQSLTEPIEFRVYMWEESTVAGFTPYIWLDLAGAGCVIEGEVLSETNSEVLAAWIPTTASGGAPENATGVEPQKKVLSPAVGSISATNVNRGSENNARSVWPAIVNTEGFDETTYLETTIDPAAGSSVTITDFVINAFNAYGSDGPEGWAASLRSSGDGFAADIATASDKGAYEIAFEVSDQLQLRNIAAPLTFRVYLWDVAPTDGSAYDPSMFVDIEGSDHGAFLGIQVIGTTGEAALSPPTIASAVFTPGTGFVVEAVNLVPGRFYDLLISYNLSDPFQSLGLETQAAGTTLTLVDGFANLETDPKAFYRISEVTPR